jgi:hypothetical protein
MLSLIKHFLHKNGNASADRNMTIVVSAIIHETARNILIKYEDRKYWLPKSMIKLEREGDSLISITLPVWLFKHMLDKLEEGLFFKKFNKRETRRIVVYFCNATFVYAFNGCESLRLAALAAAKSSDQNQRTSMVNYINDMCSNISKYQNETLGDYAIRNLMQLADEINRKDWDLNDIKEVKLRLLELNPAFSNSLDNADPTIFKKIYPEILSK